MSPSAETVSLQVSIMSTSATDALQPNAPMKPPDNTAFTPRFSISRSTLVLWDESAKFLNAYQRTDEGRCRRENSPNKAGRSDESAPAAVQNHIHGLPPIVPLAGNAPAFPGTNAAGCIRRQLVRLDRLSSHFDMSLSGRSLLPKPAMSTSRVMSRPCAIPTKRFDRSVFEPTVPSGRRNLLKFGPGS